MITLKVEYDKDLDILYIRFRDGKYAFSEEMNDNTIVDFGQNGEILAIELLDVSRILGHDLLKKTLMAEEAAFT